MRIAASMASFLIGVPLIAAGYRDGPAAGMTGGFGEPTCQQCHFDQPLNDRGGTLRLTGVPETYVTRRSYRITVTLSRDGMTRGGFEISARFASGDRKSRQAGIWRALDERVQIVGSETDPPVLFVQHTSAGSVAQKSGTTSWTMEWTGPEAVTDLVQFNVAGNASNDDASALGDYVYLQEVRSEPGQ